MRIEWLGIGLGLMLFAGSVAASGSDRADRWERADERVVDGVPRTLFVEQERTPGRPAFKIETRFTAPPALAASVLMEGMLSDDDLPKGQRREILEHDEHAALVYTFIDLPFMLSDRERALRIVRSEDPRSGVHRVDWKEANDVLPPDEGGIVRLSGAIGYWEFRPEEDGGTRATHVTQTELGGSIPDAIGYRLMKSQALDSVERLRGRIRERARTELAGSSAIVEPVRQGRTGDRARP
jgi:hypothetical protein